MLLNRVLPLLLGAAALSFGQLMGDGVRIVYAFAQNPEANCEIELTRDSIRFLSEYRFQDAPVSEKLEESGERRIFGRRILTSGERDSAEALFSLAGRWKGYRRYVCQGKEGYGYSLWSDSLLLTCDNCYSCSEGVTLTDARTLARFGKMTLWLYGLREAWPSPVPMRDAEPQAPQAPMADAEPQAPQAIQAPRAAGVPKRRLAAPGTDPSR